MTTCSGPFLGSCILFRESCHKNLFLTVYINLFFCRIDWSMNSGRQMNPFFVECLKWMWMFKITLVFPRPSLTRIYWPINFTKDIEVSGMQKNGINLDRDIHPGDSWPYVNTVFMCTLYCVWYTVFIPIVHWVQLNLMRGCSHKKIN